MRVSVFLLVAGLCFGQQVRRPEDLPLRLGPFKPKPPHKERLKNGVLLFTRTEKGAHLIEVVLLFGGGAAADPKGKRGLAYLGSQSLLVCGAGRWSAAEIRTALEDLAGRFECDVERDHIVVRLWVLPEEFERGLELLEAVLFEPHFEEEAVAEKRRSLVTVVRRWFEHSGNMARATALEALSPRRGKPLYGRPEEMRTIKRDDLLAWHRRTFVGANCLAGVAGCADKEQVARLRAMLERLRRGEPLERVPFGWAPEEVRVLIVARDGLEQVAICVAWPAPLRRDPMRPVVEMLSYIMATRISLSVREMGLAYSAYGRYIPSAAAFIAYARTHKKKASEALVRLLEAARSVAEYPPSEEAVRYVKNFFRTAFLHRFSTCFGALMRWMVAEHEGLGGRYFRTYQGKIEEADRETFVVVGRTCAPGGRMVVVLVGEEKSCRDAASKLKNARITVLGR